MVVVVLVVYGSNSRIGGLEIVAAVGVVAVILFPKDSRT